MNSEPVENQFRYVTIQFGWDAKQILIQLGEEFLWMCVWEELTVFRKVWMVFFLLILPLYDAY